VSACADCGFDPTSLTVEDAIVTLRSLPRRWRELAAAVDDDDPDAAATFRRQAEESGALEATAAEAEAVDADRWKQPGRLDALREAVHRGVHDLRIAERA
jgi:hypothetical protein